MRNSNSSPAIYKNIRDIQGIQDIIKRTTRELSLQAKGTYLTLISMTDPDTGLIVSARRDIAYECGVHPQSLDKYLKELKSKNMVWVKNHGSDFILSVRLAGDIFPQPCETLFSYNWWEAWRYTKFSKINR